MKQYTLTLTKKEINDIQYHLKISADSYESYGNTYPEQKNHAKKQSNNAWKYIQKLNDIVLG